MIKQPAIVRQLVVRALYKLRLDLSNLSETDAILTLGGSLDERPDNLARAVDLVLTHLGYAVKETPGSRFTQTRRAINKAKPPKLRGAGPPIE